MTWLQWIGSATVAAAVATVLVWPVQVTVPAPFPVYKDRDERCRYRIANLDEHGLHVEVQGGPQCRDRIFINGARISPERKA